MDRSDEVAASAAPQGDGVPDDAGITADTSTTDGIPGDTTDAPDGGGLAPERERPMTDTPTTTTRSEPDLRSSLEEQRDKYLRLAAEYDNYRKRTARERKEAGTRAQADLVRQLIDAVDDLSRFAHVDPATIDATTLTQGVELVERKLLKALTAAGLELVNPVDQPFNPELHEAVGTEPALSREDDHLVAKAYQLGYLFNGQLLRPARVVVKQWNG
jgi:molecular chaperone GrpE